MKPALVLILALSCAPAWAQTGTVTGNITDETGGALPGVTVELKGTGEPIVAVSDGEGRYTFDNTAAGTYQLSIRLINFATVTHSDVIVTAGQTTSMNDVMRLVLSAEVVVIGKRTAGPGARQSPPRRPARRPDPPEAALRHRLFGGAEYADAGLLRSSGASTTAGSGTTSGSLVKLSEWRIPSSSARAQRPENCCLSVPAW